MDNERNNLPLGEEPEELDAVIENDDDAQEGTGGFMQTVTDFIDRVDEFTYNAYAEPDESTIIEPKKSYLIIGISAALMVLLAIGSFFFFGLYPYHTTGVTVDEFIDTFNAIASDSDIRAVIPEYENIVIEEGAKLGGKRTISLYDGHVVLQAKTRFGKIIELTATGVDIPGYDPETCGISSPDGTHDYFYYFVTIGKVLAAMNENIIKDNPVETIKVSAADVSGSDAADELPTVMSATTYGYQMYFYALSSHVSGYKGIASSTQGNVRYEYNVKNHTLTIAPIEKTITSLPKGLQAVADWFTPDETPEEVALPVDTSDSDASSSDAA